MIDIKMKKLTSPIGNIKYNDPGIASSPSEIVIKIPFSIII
jgi:hypothetical protein